MCDWFSVQSCPEPRGVARSPDRGPGGVHGLDVQTKIYVSATLLVNEENLNRIK